MTLPPFDISGGWPLALARGVSVAGLLSTFGSLLARVAFVPPAPMFPAARRVLQSSLAAALLGSALWAWQVSATLADAPDMASVGATLLVVLLHTWFGHLLLLRLALLLLAAICAATLPAGVAALLGAAAVLSQSGHSHALSMHPGLSPLLVSDGLHLLAAGAWLGGLLPLVLLVRSTPPRIAAVACRRFSILGGGCVAVLAATAAAQSWSLIGSLPALLGTAYGIVALSKITLLLLLLVLAAANRLRHTPALAADRPAAAERLMRSIGAETALGLLVVFMAGLLTSLPPSMHTPIVWPFAQRPSLVAVSEDPDFRLEVIAALLALAGAACLLVLAVLLRRLRWPALGAGTAIVWFAAPHLNLLLVDAYPTSYQHSPTGFAASTIQQGAALYPAHCAACHGAQGRGDGPRATALAIPPADLTATHLWAHSDGELIWWLSHGMDAPQGGLAMPGFADTLSLPDRWALIDFVRARNAGLVQRATGAWSPPLRAPGWQAVCADGGTHTLADLHGRMVRLILVGGPVHPLLREEAGVVTILADPALRRPADGTCLAADPALGQAYALVAGVTPAEAAGGQFLIDGQGWLRAFQPAGAKPGWDDLQVLDQALDSIRTHRLAGSGRTTMPMNMPM